MANRQQTTKIKVLIVHPQEAPVVAEIDDTLETMQRIVGGYIEALYPFADPVAIVCNEEAKLIGLPLNRALFDEDGVIYDIIAGTFFIAGLGEEDFASLSPELLRKYYRRFEIPEGFRFSMKREAIA